MSENDVKAQAEAEIPAVEINEDDLESVSGGTLVTTIIGPSIIGIVLPPDYTVECGGVVES